MKGRKNGCRVGSIVWVLVTIAKDVVVSVLQRLITESVKDILCEEHYGKEFIWKMCGYFGAFIVSETIGIAGKLFQAFFDEYQRVELIQLCSRHIRLRRYKRSAPRRKNTMQTGNKKDISIRRSNMRKKKKRYRNC